MELQPLQSMLPQWGILMITDAFYTLAILWKGNRFLWAIYLSFDERHKAKKLIKVTTEALICATVVICFVLHLLVVLPILSYFLVCFYWKFHFGRLNKIALPATCWEGKLGSKSLNNTNTDRNTNKNTDTNTNTNNLKNKIALPATCWEGKLGLKEFEQCLCRQRANLIFKIK